MQRDKFVHPSFLDQRLVHRLDGIALAAAADFEAVHLSPVAPLGSCSVLAPSSQDRTLSTTRGTEVVSDPTNMLALLCAQRLRSAPKSQVRLCSVHQVLRAQPLPPQPGFSRHYRLFVLAEAGRARSEDGFELDAVRRHVATYEQLFLSAEQTLNCQFPNRKVILRTAAVRHVLRDRIVQLLRLHFPHISLETEEFESNYYDGVRILLGADTSGDEFCPIADLGVFDWVGQLLANRRYRFVASGFGIQLLPVLFTADGHEE